MFSLWTLSAVAFAYIAALFLLAWLGNRYLVAERQRPFIYSLALGVHCTTWSFFGTVAQSAQFGWAFTPTYLGSILLYLVGFPLLLKIAERLKQHNISSLAELIALRFQSSPGIAALVSVLCLMGVVPYIALQLDAITTSVNLLVDSPPAWPGGASLYVAISMALFAILFGANSLSLTDKHPGLMLTVAVQSLLKLFTFVAIGLFVVFGLYDGAWDLLGQAVSQESTRALLQRTDGSLVYLSHMLLGFAAMLCLPRQFQIAFAENNGEQEMRRARWLFPLYLFAMNLFVLPIALAGELQFAGQTVTADSYVLLLPMQAGSQGLSLAGFVGGLAAATSMVMVATLAVGIMVSNNLVTPLWLKLQLQLTNRQNLPSRTLLGIRRLIILLVLALAYLYAIHIGQTAPLANSGVMSIALMAQLLPALTLGLYWRRGGRVSFVGGLVAGIGLWFVDMLWPVIISSYYFSAAPSDAQIALAVFNSVGANYLVYVSLALLSKRQTSPNLPSVNHAEHHWRIELNSLRTLVTHVLDRPQIQEHLVGSGYANGAQIKQVELALSAQVGLSSARILLSAIAEAKPLGLKNLVALVEDASQTYQFNHELLQSSLQHIQQGISVVDRELKLLAWNKRYLELFDYPENFIQAGVSLKTVLEYNGRRGLFGDNVDIDQEVEKRLNLVRQGSSYRYQRRQPDGKVIELQGSPMPGGGFVTTYTDITEFINAQQALSQAKAELEQRVAERTADLHHANTALTQAKAAAELASESKTKFLAAAGHDLMQPFNAASLFAALLAQKTQSTPLAETTTGLVKSLQSAEDLLTSLLDMSKLETGLLVPNVQPFALGELLESLGQEFRLLAQEKGLRLTVIKTQVWVISDKRLLKRILQNLLANAIRYTERGSILLGVRRHSAQISIEVLDTGSGIAEAEQQVVFEEFRQLQQGKNPGLGLGLTIVERLSHLLNHPLHLDSHVGKGSRFSLKVARHATPQRQTHAPTVETESAGFLQHKRVCIIDNETQVLAAMHQLFSDWGASVVSATDEEKLLQQLNGSPAPDLLLADYHLDHGHTGIAAIANLQQYWGQTVPTVLNSANYDEEIRQQAIDAGCLFLHKPIKPGALKRLLKQRVFKSD